MNIRKNIEKILDDIKTYSPHPEKVNLVAVTKYVDTETIEEVLNCGINILGENKVQVLIPKFEKLQNFKTLKRWHFIGNLQKNKVKYIAPFIDMIHSVNKLSLAEEINNRAKLNNRIIDVLIEINIFNEDNKEGYEYSEFLENIPKLLTLKNIRVKGLMTMAPYIDDEEILKNGFKKLKKIKDFLNEKYFNNEMTELSMGMSNDYKIALKEGSTLIRVGSNLYK